MKAGVIAPLVAARLHRPSEIAPAVRTVVRAVIRAAEHPADHPARHPVIRPAGCAGGSGRARAPARRPRRAGSLPEIPVPAALPVGHPDARLAAGSAPLSDLALELAGIGLAEVLRCVLRLAGPQLPGGVGVELRVAPDLAIVVVRFTGAAMPGWLLANWDRGRPAAVLAPMGDCGAGWPLVRESFDSVEQVAGRRANLLFLERRL